MPVNVIGTLKPKNNGKFPVAEAVDIKVTDDLRLDEALENKADLSTVNFALAGKADNSDINSLQSQINEIITPVTQDAEVQNARVGADGTSYQTLKERLDTENDTLSTVANSISTDVETAYNGGSRIISMTSDKWQIGKRVSGYTVIDGKKYPNVGDFAGTNMLIIPLSGLTYIHATADLTWNEAAYSPIEITAADGTFINSIARDALINETAELPWLTYVTTGGYKIDVEKLRESYSDYELGSIYICQSKTETAEWLTETVVKGLAELTNIVNSLDLEQLRDFVINGAVLFNDVANWTVGYRVSTYTVVDGKKVPNVLPFDGCKYAVVDISSSTIESVESDADLTWGEAAYSPIVIVDSTGSVSLSPAWYISKDELINETAERPWLAYKQGGGYKIDVRVLKETYPDYKIKDIYICQANVESVSWSVKQTVLGLESATASIINIQSELANPFIVVPKESVAIIGHEWNMYFENIIGGYSDEFYVKIRCTNADTMNGTLYEDLLRFTPSPEAVGDHTVYIYVYSKVTGKIVCESEFTLHVINDTPIAGKKALFIGDSLTDDGYYPCEIQGHLSNNGITSIGTMSDTRVINGDSITAANEGRGGWTTTNYINNQSVGDVDNAFYNPSTAEFDFSYYMNHNNFNGVDIVSIYLGTNADSSFDVTLSNLDAMIDSIHKYSSSIKIIICLFHQVANQSGCGNHNGLQVSKEMSMDRMAKNRKLIERYENNPDYPNVHIAELNFSVDGNNDYSKVTQPLSARNPETIVRLNNNVHPNVYGYLKIADVLYNRIRYILD